MVMFDARSLLENLVRGPAQAQKPATQTSDSRTELADLLRQFTQGGNTAAGSDPQLTGGRKEPGLEDLLGSLFPDAKKAPSSHAAPDQARDAPASGGGLGGILGQIQDAFGQSKSGSARQPGTTGQAGQSGGGPLDMLGQIFGQATDGVKEGAGRIGQATGLDEIIGKISGGRSTDELVEQVKRYMAENKIGTGAALGGLGALILGTQTGRSVAASAAKLGALALIGGLAYKAYRNYSEGRPLVSGNEPLEPAPAGSGFTEEKVSNETATNLIRAMIAAAASDGRLDAKEQQAILGNLQGSGLDAGAEEFLARELNNPASIRDLVDSVTTDEEAVKLYTAARIAIEPDTDAEQSFLYELGTELGIDRELRAHVDAQAKAAAVAT